MSKKKAGESQAPKIRLFPPVLGVAAYVFITIFSRYRKGFSLLSSLGSFAFTMSLFLVLITVIDLLNRIEFWGKGKCFFSKAAAQFSKVFLKTNKEALEEIDAEQEEIREQPGEPQGDLAQDGLAQDGLAQDGLAQDGLLEIKRENIPQAGTAGISLEQRVYSWVYITGFLGLAVWRVIAMLKIKPWGYAAQYSGSIVDAVLLLILPCVSVLYLKTRKEDSCPTDAISRDMLTLFSYLSSICAGIIAASAVLKVNLLIVLPWIYYAVSLYLIASLAVNVALSFLKGNILDFNYALFPKVARQKEATGDFEDSPEASWKVSLKSLYTIRYTLAIFPALALALGLVIWLSTTLFVVQPHQQALVYRFGKIDRSSIKEEGLHFKLPWPIDKAALYDVHRAASMQIGYESTGTGNFIWGQAHDGGEHMLLLGNGNEIVAANLKIMYVISDLYLYIKTCTNPELVLSAAAYNALMSRTVNTTLDSFLNVDRNSLSESMLEELSRFCESENLGFSVIQVIIESIHPPVDLANVYQSVVSASVDKTTATTRAHSYAAAKVIEAARQSKFAIDGARAMQYSRVSDAQKEAAVIFAAAEAYSIAGSSYELAKRLDVYEKIIKSNKVYVFSPGVERNLSRFIIGKVNTLNLSDVQGEGQ